MACKLFLFDLDGTVVDTAPDLAEAANAVRTARGIAPLPIEDLRPFASRGAPGLLGKAMGVKKTDADFPALRDEFLANYALGMTVRSAMFEGVGEMLGGLRKAGIRIGIVTNKYEHLALKLVEGLGIAERFDIVLGSDSEGCAMKPAPDSLLRAAALLDVPVSEILYAGDDPRDIEAAHRAGMPAAACRWGYWSVSPDECGADIVATHPSELVDWALKA